MSADTRRTGASLLFVLGLIVFIVGAYCLFAGVPAFLASESVSTNITLTVLIMAGGSMLMFAGGDPHGAVLGRGCIWHRRIVTWWGMVFVVNLVTCTWLTTRLLLAHHWQLTIAPAAFVLVVGGASLWSWITEPAVADEPRD